MTATKPTKPEALEYQFLFRRGGDQYVYRVNVLIAMLRDPKARKSFEQMVETLLVKSQGLTPEYAAEVVAECMPLNDRQYFIYGVDVPTTS